MHQSFWKILFSAASCSALGVHTTYLPRGSHPTFLGHRTLLEVGGAEGLASSSDGDVVVGKTMEVWCDCRHSSSYTISDPYLASCDAVIVDKDDKATRKQASDNNQHPKYYYVETTKDQFTDRLICSKTKQLMGILVNITSEKGQQRALEAIGSVQWIVAYTDNHDSSSSDASSSKPWLMIPAENLIGAAYQSGTKIAFVVERVPDVMGLSQALQVGVDALCLKSSDADSKLWDTVMEAEKDRQGPLIWVSTEDEPMKETTSIEQAILVTNEDESVQETTPIELSQEPSILVTTEDESVQETTAIEQRQGPAIVVATEDESTKETMAIKQPQEPARVETTTEDEAASETTSIVSGSCWRMPLNWGSASSSVIADRVCIDFVRNLAPTEGVWVGSSSKLMALVLSEAATSSFVPSRPFRVNAGPVHSYVTLSDGVRTKYLCELQAGDEVLVYDSLSGQERSVAVGRLKVEVRPCVLVGLQPPLENDTSGTVTTGQIFLQQAETVRLGQLEGTYVRVTDLDVAELPEEVPTFHDVLLRIASTGTHVGGRYAGKVDER